MEVSSSQISSLYQADRKTKQDSLWWNPQSDVSFSIPDWLAPLVFPSASCQFKCGNGFASVLDLGWRQERFLSFADCSLRTGPQEGCPPPIASHVLDATFGTEASILSLSDSQSREPSPLPNKEYKISTENF